MQFHEKVRRRVQELGINKAKAARDVGLPESTISNYLSKVESLPRVDIAWKIAKALNVPLDWLADDSLDWPPAPLDTQNLGAIPDDVFMDEACRRLVNQAKRIAFDLERVKKENWPDVADELLNVKTTDELLPEQERVDFLLSLLFGASGDLRAFDATRAMKSRRLDGPDLDDLVYEVERLRKLPEFDILKAYFSLRFVADVLKRHNAPQAEWDARDVEGQRKQLIANLSRQRKAAKTTKA